MSKKLKIYKENGEFVIERINEFNHATKRFFVTQDGLFDGLKTGETGYFYGRERREKVHA